LRRKRSARRFRKTSSRLHRVSPPDGMGPVMEHSVSEN
jgi:hypothetical protein